MTKKGAVRTTRLCVLAGLLLLSAVTLLSLSYTENGWTLRLLRATHVTWERPKRFEGFHLLMLGICVATAVTSGLLHKKAAPHLDRIVFGAGVFLFLMELYKQLYYYFVIGNGYYNFGILPLQFCSYALYLFLLVPLLPEGKLKDALYKFCALYQTMGGCIVMAYPGFYDEISLCVHTMLWHIVMIAAGVLILFARGYGKRYFRELLPATVVFLPTVAIALLLNFTLYPLTENSMQPLNLFYISPYQVSNYVVIGDVQRLYGWEASVLCYVLLFVLVGAGTVWLFARAFRRIGKRLSEK